VSCFEDLIVELCVVDLFSVLADLHGDTDFLPDDGLSLLLSLVFVLMRHANLVSMNDSLELINGDSTVRILIVEGKQFFQIAFSADLLHIKAEGEELVEAAGAVTVDVHLIPDSVVVFLSSSKVY
jgi:hypothetical protein